MNNIVIKAVILNQLSKISQAKDETALLNYLKNKVFKKKHFEYIKDNYLVFLLKFGKLEAPDKKQLIKILENREPTFERRVWIRDIQKKYDEFFIRQLVFN